MMKYLSVILFFLLGTFVLALAQSSPQSSIRFDKSQWNFGRISELGGKQEHIFHFANDGTASLVVNRVVSTCACTVASYSKEPITPGNKGYVKVIFDPKGQMNKIAKQLRVIYDEGRKIHTLHINGFVDVELNPDIDFPYELAPSIFADKWMLNFHQLQHHNKPIVMKINLWNKNSHLVQLSYQIRNKKTGILLTNAPVQIQPRSMKQLLVTIKPLNDYYGTYTDEIIVRGNGSTKQNILIYGVMVDDFRGVSMLTGPQLKVMQSSIKLKEKNERYTMDYNIPISNIGKSQLCIRKIECPVGFSVIDKNKKQILDAGATRHLQIRVSPKNKRINETTVKIITNDPRKPVFPIIFH